MKLIVSACIGMFVGSVGVLAHGADIMPFVETAFAVLGISFAAGWLGLYPWRK